MAARSHTTCVVTVTYGRRVGFLKKVIDASFASGVAEVVVVDNGLSPPARLDLEDLCRRYGTSIHVLTHRYNKGSAGGYKAGLVFAHHQTHCGFVWLLDDDNVPEPEALRELHRAHAGLESIAPNLLALLSLRPVGRKHFEKLARGVPPELVFPRRSSFRHVHIANLFDRRRRRRHFEASVSMDNDQAPVPIPYAPYGGLFFHIGLLDQIGYPEDAFYLYADDREFSYRIPRQGGSIFLIPSSRIHDIDLSAHHCIRPGSAYQNLLNGDPQFFKTYYLVRNNSYFQSHFWTDSRWLYSINKCLFFMGLLRYALQTRKLKRFMQIWQAVHEGELGRLGYRQTMNRPDAPRNRACP
jgi:GT2 family glycosyltransferase